MYHEDSFVWVEQAMRLATKAAGIAVQRKGAAASIPEIKDLKGIETGTMLCPCPECVRNAVLALGEVLGEQPEI